MFIAKRDQSIEELKQWLMDDAMWIALGISLLRILLILAAARVAIWVVHRVVTHFILNRDTSRLHVEQRRVQTIGKLLKNVASYAIYFITLLLVLSEFNINLGPLLAGAGVVGLAIGFGAQSLVKDVITGFFIILEDQFAVGDVIQTGTYKGTVEMIGLRTTRLQSWTGEVFIIPNGSIIEVTNFSLNNSLAIVDVAVAYEEDIDRAIDAIRETTETFEDENLAKPAEVLGVQALGPSVVTLRIIAECRPNTQASVSRRLNAEVKKTFDARGIEIPYPKTVTYYRGERGGA